jgi:uncharacterized membrane protein YobD (UPF0266 family)
MQYRLAVINYYLCDIILNNLCRRSCVSVKWILSSLIGSALYIVGIRWRLNEVERVDV